MGMSKSLVSEGACRGFSMKTGQEPAQYLLSGLTCGISRTPDCSHLSCWCLFPHHSPKVVLITDLMGLYQGTRNKGRSFGKGWELEQDVHCPN